MFRYILTALVGMFATTAAAQTAYEVRGATPATSYTVCAEDTLLLRKKMERDLQADGTRHKDFSVWIDRAAPGGANGFLTPGATKLQYNGYDATKGHIYAPMDAAPCAVPEPAPTALFGANLSGGEAAEGDAVRPGLDDFKGYIEYYGFDLIRYPFKDNRMTAARIAELKVNVDYAISKNVPVILDNHTYRWDTPTQFVNFWVGFIANFPKSDLVMIDLVNEPQGFNDTVLTNDWDQWARDTNLTIAALRQAGVTNPILIEYPQWSAIFRFDKNEASYKASESAGTALDRVGGLKDPLNKTYINGHRYFDVGSKGVSGVCVDSQSAITEFAAALRKRNLKGYITEMAFGSSYKIDPSCVAVGAESIAAVKANADVIKGVTWWGGGRIWKEDYHFKIDAAKATRYSVPLNPYLVQIKGD